MLPEPWEEEARLISRKLSGLFHSQKKAGSGAGWYHSQLMPRGHQPFFAQSQQVSHFSPFAGMHWTSESIDTSSGNMTGIIDGIPTSSGCVVAGIITQGSSGSASGEESGCARPKN